MRTETGQYIKPLKDEEKIEIIFPCLERRTAICQSIYILHRSYFTCLLKKVHFVLRNVSNAEKHYIKVNN